MDLALACYDDLLGQAFRLTCGVREDAEDLVQQAYLRHAETGGPADPSRVKAWLSIVMRNVWVNRFRSGEPLEHWTVSLGPDYPDPAW
jgi:DNA-directed RNA polymerase specialized sigma24 family protein